MRPRLGDLVIRSLEGTLSLRGVSTEVEQLRVFPYPFGGQQSGLCMQHNYAVDALRGSVDRRTLLPGL